jgi:hypothetical protein
MSSKLYGLISTIVVSMGTIGSALVGYFQPTNYVAIVGGIAIAVPAINDILLLFVKTEGKEKNE